MPLSGTLKNGSNGTCYVYLTTTGKCVECPLCALHGAYIIHASILSNKHLERARVPRTIPKILDTQHGKNRKQRTETHGVFTRVGETDK